MSGYHSTEGDDEKYCEWILNATLDGVSCSLDMYYDEYEASFNNEIPVCSAGLNGAEVNVEDATLAAYLKAGGYI